MKNITLGLKKFNGNQLFSIYEKTKNRCIIVAKTNLAKTRLQNLLELVAEEIIQEEYVKEHYGN
jgi:hypothetical protein